MCLLEGSSRDRIEYTSSERDFKPGTGDSEPGCLNLRLRARDQPHVRILDRTARRHTSSRVGGSSSPAGRAEAGRAKAGVGVGVGTSNSSLRSALAASPPCPASNSSASTHSATSAHVSAAPRPPGVPACGPRRARCSRWGLCACRAMKKGCERTADEERIVRERREGKFEKAKPSSRCSLTTSWSITDVGLKGKEGKSSDARLCNRKKSTPTLRACCTRSSTAPR